MKYAPDDDAKSKNRMRFYWHEKVIASVALRRFPNAIVLAGYMLHRFHVGKGYVQLSFNSAAKELQMPRTSVIRARNRLLRQGWITVLEQPERGVEKWPAIKYGLAGGPDDLLLDGGKDTGDTDATAGEVA